jgi:hypothetical protein
LLKTPDDAKQQKLGILGIADTFVIEAGFFSGHESKKEAWRISCATTTLSDGQIYRNVNAAGHRVKGPRAAAAKYYDVMTTIMD